MSIQAQQDTAVDRPVAGLRHRRGLFGLVRVETVRFRSRRAITWILLIGAVVVAAAAFKIAWDTRPLNAAELASAQAQAYSANQDPDVVAQVAACRKNPTAMFGSDATVRDCRHLQQRPADFYPRQSLTVPHLLQREGVAISVLVAGLLVLCGCTFVGADISRGSIAGQLLTEPRRVRLWWAKAVAVAVAAFVVSVVLLGAFWAALLLLARSRGIAVTHDDLTSVLGQGGRGVVLAVGGAVGAYALTVLFRHTTTTLALLFAYSVGGAIVVNLLPLAVATRWSLGNNVQGWLQHGFQYVTDTGRCSDGCALGQAGSGLFLLALLVVAIIVSLVAFSRRDA